MDPLIVSLRLTPSRRENLVSMSSAEDVLAELTSYAERYLYAWEHIGEENEHIHLILWLSVTVNYFRSKVTNLGFRGNRSYSMKRLRDDPPLKAMAYLMKDEPKPHSSNVPSSWISAAQSLVDKHKEENAAKKNEQKKLVHVILEMALNLVKVKDPDFYSLLFPEGVGILPNISTYKNHHRFLLRDYVQRSIIAYHQSREKVINPQYCRNIEITILGLFVDERIFRKHVFNDDRALVSSMLSDNLGPHLADTSSKNSLKASTCISKEEPEEDSQSDFDDFDNPFCSE